jgi:RNA polymerase sigma-70 factor, ECF subfamily
VTEDRKVWKQICDGDVAAFHALYREQAPRLFAFVRRMTGNTHAAEDILQETFAEFWKRPARYNPDFGSLRAWLFGIARKQVSAWWRKQETVPTDTEEPATPSYVEISSILQDAMDRLPHQQRLLLWLREVEGQSYEELAGILDVPLGTIRSRLFAAREALRKVWHGELPHKETVHEVR